MKRRKLKGWVVNTLVTINFILIMLMASEVEDLKVFIISKVIMLIIFCLISLLLYKQSDIFKDDEVE